MASEKREKDFTYNSNGLRFYLFWTLSRREIPQQGNQEARAIQEINEENTKERVSELNFTVCFVSNYQTSNWILLLLASRHSFVERWSDIRSHTSTRHTQNKFEQKTTHMSAPIQRTSAQVRELIHALSSTKWKWIIDAKPKSIYSFILTMHIIFLLSLLIFFSFFPLSPFVSPKYHVRNFSPTVISRLFTVSTTCGTRIDQCESYGVATNGTEWIQETYDSHRSQSDYQSESQCYPSPVKLLVNRFGTQGRTIAYLGKRFSRTICPRSTGGTRQREWLYNEQKSVNDRSDQHAHPRSKARLSSSINKLNHIIFKNYFTTPQSLVTA